VLKIEGLRAGYEASVVLEDIALDVPEGAAVAILGRNGMGKTTLCRSVMSLAPPTVWGGSVSYQGQELSRLASYEVAKAGIGYVPQGRHVFASLDVVENLTVAARAGSNGNTDTWDLDRVWELFPSLKQRRANQAGQLSGGEQQMLAIARALMTNPRLLIMDEPSEGLAPTIVDTVREQLQSLKQNALSLLLVEHNYPLAIALADFTYVLEKGEIVFSGSAAELDADEDVKRRYLGVGT
jgi:branched-chain amino acid transport system ATP-binding protein